MQNQPKKINVLPPSVFNLIAAGEVVARPANVVKELVENSIDAGANFITISITGGGLKSIRVSDNGCGIANDDIKNAFLPHATSKIQTAKDLAQITSMGFRGEALASIASISNCEIISKTTDAETATKYDVTQNKITFTAASGGTTVTVSNLFYNTPARLKFLKSAKSEESEITNLVENYERNKHHDMDETMIRNRYINPFFIALG